jgi:hypothetical protein
MRTVRALLALATGAGAACAGGGLVAAGAQPSAPPSCTVTVTGVDPPIALRGEEVTVSGSGFTCGGAASGQPAVTVGGRPAALRGTAADGSLVIEAGDASGGVQVSAHDQGCHSCPAPAPSNEDHLLIAAPRVASTTITTAEGGRIAVTGSGLDLGGQLAGVDALACAQDLAADDHDDTAVTLTAPDQFCQGPLTLRLSAFTDTERDATTRWSLPAGRLDTAMIAGAPSTAHASPGETVRIPGTGFGQSGRVLLGGRPAPSTWFDRAVEVSPPADAVSGELELVRFDGRSVDAGRLTVDASRVGHAQATHPPVPGAAVHIPPTPSPAPPSSPGATSPVLALQPQRSSGLPGHDVPFTVTVTTGGAPLAGAAVDLAVVRVPADDASVTPALGLTDGAGRVVGLLHLSRRPGDHVIVARSGRSTDQVTVAACCRPPVPPAAGRVTPDNTDSPAPHPLIAATLAACLVLFVAGFTLNLATSAAPGTNGARIRP